MICLHQTKVAIFLLLVKKECCIVGKFGGG